MKQLLILLAVAIASCTNPQPAKQPENNIESHSDEHGATLSLNNGAKWKADDVTKKNVADLVQIINDPAYAGVATREQLYTRTQAKIDTLINQCTMKGPDHEALHAWLGKVLTDVRELKNADHEFDAAYAALKKDVESFYQYFE